MQSREDLRHLLLTCLMSATPRPQPVWPTQRCCTLLLCELCLDPQPPEFSFLTTDVPQGPADVGG